MRSMFTISISVTTVVAFLVADRIAQVPTASAFCMPKASPASLSLSNKSQLFAKPKKEKQRRKNIANNNRNFETAEASPIPANLKRKVEAKRPSLGHVVPEATRTKGSGGSANPVLRPQGRAREAGLNNPSNLKIFGGTARGRRLDSPSVYLRPMMGKVREAVYSTLISFGVYDYPVRHLDLFSGSGSVGLESMSRGAKHCTFCDLAEDCCAAISRNIPWCQFDGPEYSTRIVHADVLKLLREPVAVGIPEGETFNIVTICPPYEEVTYADLLDATANSPLVEEDTIVLLEYPVELWGDLPHVYSGDSVTMIGIRNRKYGRTVIAMYICNPTGRIELAESRPEEFI
mmetsp:Transcript_18264/g.41900  ORF Transcript_18264/g.41900 Transcript_18264/m.41900 type:complete len:346 (-) Transcript_18264:43-1080(-)